MFGISQVVPASRSGRRPTRPERCSSAHDVTRLYPMLDPSVGNPVRALLQVAHVYVRMEHAAL